MESCNTPMAISMKATGSKIVFLVTKLIMSLRTVIGTMEKQNLDSLRAWVDYTSKRKVPTKDNS